MIRTRKAGQQRREESIAAFPTLGALSHYGQRYMFTNDEAAGQEGLEPEGLSQMATDIYFLFAVHAMKGHVLQR